MDLTTIILITLLVFSLFLLILFLFLINRYNLFIISRNKVKTDYSDVEVQVKRRASLIQNVANVVKEYAGHENETFSQVAAARSALDNSKTPHEVAEADNILTETLRSLVMVTEDYPELKANENYTHLQNDLRDTENIIAKYREEYNKSVETYNNSIQTFPNLVAAVVFNFKEEELFVSAPDLELK